MPDLAVASFTETEGLFRDLKNQYERAWNGTHTDICDVPTVGSCPQPCACHCHTHGRYHARIDVEQQRRDAILALPRYTLVNVGLRPPSGKVQGGIYYRIGDGLGPTGRDTTAAGNLRRETDSWIDHNWPWGFDILAVPVESTDG